MILDLQSRDPGEPIVFFFVYEEDFKINQVAK